MSFSFQSCSLYLCSLDSRTCFACGSPQHECCNCNQRILRYRSIKSGPSPSSALSSPSRSYASVVKPKPTLKPLVSASSLNNDLVTWLTDVVNTLVIEVKALKASVSLLESHNSRGLTLKILKNTYLHCFRILINLM